MSDDAPLPRLSHRTWRAWSETAEREIVSAVRRCYAAGVPWNAVHTVLIAEAQNVREANIGAAARFAELARLQSEAMGDRWPAHVLARIAEGWPADGRPLSDPPQAGAGG